MYMIVGKYKAQKREVIDTFESRKDAEYNLNEYRLAFGKDWVLWIEREKDL